MPGGDSRGHRVGRSSCRRRGRVIVVAQIMVAACAPPRRRCGNDRHHKLMWLSLGAPQHTKCTEPPGAPACFDGNRTCLNGRYRLHAPPAPVHVEGVLDARRSYLPHRLAASTSRKCALALCIQVAHSAQRSSEIATKTDYSFRTLMDARLDTTPHMWYYFYFHGTNSLISRSARADSTISLPAE